MPSATYDNIWQKRVLVPFWVVQIIVLIIYLVVAGLSIAAWQIILNDDSGDYPYGAYEGEDVSDLSGAFYAVVGVLMAVTVACLIFNIVEMVLLARKRLSPVTLVVLSSISTALWAALFIISLVGIARAGWGGGFIWPVILLGSYLGKLIYAGIILHRFRKGRFASRGTYAPAQVESQYQPYTSYNPATGNVVPNVHSKDPSRDVSPAPASQQYLPEPAGAAQEYYDPARGGQSFEMESRAHRQ